MPRRAWTFLLLVAVTTISLHAEEQLDRRRLFGGEIDGAYVDIVFVDQDGEITGAAWHRPALPSHPWDQPISGLRLLTGRQTGNRLSLSEWQSASGQTAEISASLRGDSLTGTWTLSGAAKPVAFSFWEIRFNESQLTNTTMTSWPVAEALYRAIRAGQWNEAELQARLLCVVPSREPCAWRDVVQALASGNQLGGIEKGAWDGLLLEKQGRFSSAFYVFRESCLGRAEVTACLLMTDLVDHADRESREDALRRACELHRVGCERVWGEDNVALIQAARCADLQAIDELLDRGANPDAGGGWLHTPLQSAILAGSWDAAQLLLSRGADSNHLRRRNGAGIHEPIRYAMDNGMDRIVLLLLDFGAKGSGNGVLWTAAHQGKREIVTTILASGANVDDDVAPAGSPLTAAVDRGDLKMARLLLAHGASPDVETNHSDGSPIDHARARRNKAMLRLLMDARRDR